MAVEWYCQVQGKVRGPFSGLEIKRMAAEGKLSSSDRVGKTASGPWSLASQVKGLEFPASAKKPEAKGPPVPAATKCPSCQADLAAKAVLCVQCGFDRRTGKKIRTAESAISPPAPENTGKGRVLILAGIAALLLASGGAWFFLGQATDNSTGLPRTPAGTPQARNPADPGKQQVHQETPAVPGSKLPSRASQVTKDWANRMVATTNPLETFTRRSKANQGEDTTQAYKAWMAALETKAGRRPDTIQFMMFFFNFQPLFKDDLFQPEKSAVYLERIQLTPPHAIKAWMGVLNRFAGTPFDEASALVNLIQIESVFTGQQFQGSQLDQFLARANQVPEKDAEVLAATVGLGAKKEEALVELITQDWLYQPEGSFNRPLFEESLALVRAAREALPPVVAKESPPVTKETPREPAKPESPFHVQVTQSKTQKSYSYNRFGNPVTLSAKGGDTLLVVRVAIRNDLKSWQTLSSTLLRIVDNTGKAVDAPFLGFGENLAASGTIDIGGITTSDGAGNVTLKTKGKIDSLEPRNTEVLWELAPGSTYQETFLFVVPEAIPGPRLEIGMK